MVCFSYKWFCIAAAASPCKNKSNSRRICIGLGCLLQSEFYSLEVLYYTMSNATPIPTSMSLYCFQAIIGHIFSVLLQIDVLHINTFYNFTNDICNIEEKSSLSSFSSFWCRGKIIKLCCFSAHQCPVVRDILLAFCVPFSQVSIQRCAPKPQRCESSVVTFSSWKPLTVFVA